MTLIVGSVIHCVTVSLRKRLGFINGDVVSRMGVKVLQEGQLQLASVLRVTYYVV